MEKLTEWKNKLLDLGRRNKLINFKTTKVSDVQLIAPDAFTIFDWLENAAAVALFDAEARLRTEKLSAQELVDQYAPKLKKNTALLYNEKDNPTRVLRKINASVKDFLSEKGVDILFVCFGQLHWVDPKDGVECRSPLVLYPVCFGYDNATSRYQVEPIDREIGNLTLYKKLADELGVELPPYDDEKPLQDYFDALQPVIERYGWYITHEVYVSTLYYYKINMYNDLTKNEASVLANPHVAKLLGEPTGEPEQDWSDALQQYDMTTLHNVVDADSSQNRATALSALGASFVLQGPPGTGKSQTITNIIAEALWAGKKVLFVSEKLAALDVVLDNLRKAGIGDYCLPMHNPGKAHKSGVIADLYEVLLKEKTEVSPKGDKVMCKRNETMAMLDAYCRALHTPVAGVGLTPYQLFGLCAHWQSAPQVDHIIPAIESKNMAYLERSVAILDLYAKFSETVGRDYRKNAWHGFAARNLTYAQEAKLQQQLTAVNVMVTELAQIGYEMQSEFAFSYDNIDEAQKTIDYLRWLADLPNYCKLFFLKNAIPHYRAKLQEAMALLDKKKAHAATVGECLTPDALLLASDTLQCAIDESRSIWRLFSPKYKKHTAPLFACLKSGKKLSAKKVRLYATAILQWQDVNAQLQTVLSALAPMMGNYYQQEDTDFARFVAYLDEAESLMSDNKDYTGFGQDFANLKSKIRRQLRPLAASVKKGLEALDGLLPMWNETVFSLRGADLKAVRYKTDACLAQMDELAGWRDFLGVMEQLRQESLVNYLHKAIETPHLAPTAFSAAYCRRFYEQWQHVAIADSDELQNFGKLVQDKTVAAFVENDVLSFDVNKAAIGAELSAKKPTVAGAIVEGSPVGLLHREAQKKRRQMPIRLLMQKIPELIQCIKPCFLMSPLSVSTYFTDAADIRFDLIIFDEASQIFPEDALCAIYRAKQMIVVGDSKQMPPSRFFMTSGAVQDDTDTDEYEDALDGYESVLDLCAARFYNERLKWHYRSHSEDLISFSNEFIYNDGNSKLATFPSARYKAPYFGVDFYCVDGYFDSSTHGNAVEAETVVDRIVDTAQQYPGYSIGVIAFGIGQQRAIEAALERRMAQDATIAELLRENESEPFFIKNLETVQGNERDFIILSVGYSKGKDGKLRMNFGPILGEGGERRLNVAITRAKINVQLVSSIRYTDFAAGPEKKLGVELLKLYLQFAETGELPKNADKAHRNITEQKEESFDLARDVVAFLRQKGYVAETDIGTSDYPVDIAVRHPSEQRYVLAIELDGARYAALPSVRDRDRLRRSVLERLGWNYYRLWSTEWQKNGAAEKKKLLAVLDKCLSGYVPIAKEAESVAFSVPKTEEMFLPYKKADCFKLLQSYAKTRRFNALVAGILKVESPIAERELLQYIYPIYGERITPKVKDQFEVNLRLMKGIVRRNGFVYAEKDAAMDVLVLRVPKQGETREVGTICVEETAGGVLSVLRQNGSADQDGIAKTFSDLLGYSRLSPSVEAQVQQALQYLLQRQLVVLADNMYSINGQE